ncbi:hypothetical protein GCM10020000_31570 [Streptomyces olivoverticillatus]
MKVAPQAVVRLVVRRVGGRRVLLASDAVAGQVRALAGVEDGAVGPVGRGLHRGYGGRGGDRLDPLLPLLVGEFLGLQAHLAEFGVVGLGQGVDHVGRDDGAEAGVISHIALRPTGRCGSPGPRARFASMAHRRGAEMWGA